MHNFKHKIKSNIKKTKPLQHSLCIILGENLEASYNTLSIQFPNIYISKKYIKNKDYNCIYKQLFLEDGFKNKYYITIGKTKTTYQDTQSYLT